MKIIKTYNFILKTEILDKCKETIIMNKKQMEHMYHNDTADRNVLFNYIAVTNITVY